MWLSGPLDGIKPKIHFKPQGPFMFNPVLQATDRDALAKACGIGMSHAATALSRLLGKPVRVGLPRLRILEPGSLADLEAMGEMTGILLEIQGEVSGSILVLLAPVNARRLLELMLGKLPVPGESWSELEASALQELGNILASACLHALGDQLGLTLLPSVPTLECGEAAALLDQLLGHHAKGGTALMIDTTFSSTAPPLSGSLLLIPASASLGAILSGLGSQ